MSGRKSWEVASVLNEVEKVYDKIVNEYTQEIKSNLLIFKEMKTKTKVIEKKINELDDESLKKELNSFKNWLDSAKNIEDDASEVFKNIKQSKEESKDLRKKIANSSHYMNAEYAKAQNIKDSLNKSKKELLNLKNSSLELKNRAKKLKTVLENIEDLYEAKKRFLSVRLQDIEKRFTQKELLKIEDFVVKNDIKVSRCEYFDHYMGKKTVNEINNYLKETRELLESEKFAECEKSLKEIDDRLNEIFAQTYGLEENIESSFALTIKIRDLMINEINFREAKVDLIDGNPAKGFKLICKNGDTLIFDEIKVNYGEVKVELDHIEKVNGSCGVRWEEMKVVLNRNGIPLTDVTKDGKSIFDKSRFKDRRVDRRERER